MIFSLPCYPQKILPEVEYSTNLGELKRKLRKQKVRLAMTKRTFANFFGSLYGAEGGTRQRGEKDSNQLAVLLDKLKEQGSYGDPVSGPLTRCARCLI